MPLRIHLRMRASPVFSQLTLAYVRPSERHFITYCAQCDLQLVVDSQAAVLQGLSISQVDSKAIKSTTLYTYIQSNKLSQN